MVRRVPKLIPCPNRARRASRLPAVGTALLICTLARAAGPATQSESDSDPGNPPSVQAAIVQLGDQKYTVREDAEHYLLRQSPQVLPVIEKSLSTSEDAEVIMRLTRVAVHLFLKGQTYFDGHAGLLGIGLNIETIRIGPHDDDVRRAVDVMQLEPGFPAAEMLRPGDRIIAINHEPIPLEMNIDAFRQQVNSTPPGTIMLLTVLRGRSQLDVPVKIAGVPDDGIEAISNFVAQRSEAAQAFLQGLNIPHESALTIHSTEGATITP